MRAPTRRIVPCLFLLVLFTSLNSVPARAQGETTAAIVGQVMDASGGAIPGAAVTISSRETGLRRAAKTDNEGRFNFPQLLPGTYSVRVEAPGFQTQQMENVICGLGQKQTVNFVLKVAQANQTVRIMSEAPLLN